MKRLVLLLLLLNVSLADDYDYFSEQISAGEPFRFDAVIKNQNYALIKASPFYFQWLTNNGNPAYLIRYYEGSTPVDYRVSMPFGSYLTIIFNGKSFYFFVNGVFIYDTSYRSDGVFSATTNGYEPSSVSIDGIHYSFSNNYNSHDFPDGYCYDNFFNIDDDDDIDCCLKHGFKWALGSYSRNACCGDDSGESWVTHYNAVCCDNNLYIDGDEAQCACNKLNGDWAGLGGQRNCCGDDLDESWVVNEVGVCSNGEWVEGRTCNSVSDCSSLPSCSGDKLITYTCDNHICSPHIGSSCSLNCAECCSDNDCADSYNFGSYSAYTIGDGYCVDAVRGVVNNGNYVFITDSCKRFVNSCTGGYDGNGLCFSNYKPNKCYNNKCVDYATVPCIIDYDCANLNLITEGGACVNDEIKLSPTGYSQNKWCVGYTSSSADITTPWYFCGVGSKNTLGCENNVLAKTPKKVCRDFVIITSTGVTYYTYQKIDGCTSNTIGVSNPKYTVVTELPEGLT